MQFHSTADINKDFSWEPCNNYACVNAKLNNKTLNKLINHKKDSNINFKHSITIKLQTYNTDDYKIPRIYKIQIMQYASI